MLGSIRRIVSKTIDTADKYNPFVKRFDDTMKSITDTLMKAGFSDKEITDYIFVAELDLDEYLEIERGYEERKKREANANKATTAKTTKRPIRKTTTKKPVSKAKPKTTVKKTTGNTKTIKA